jgi:hypothetical protein
MNYAGLCHLPFTFLKLFRSTLRSRQSVYSNSWFRHNIYRYSLTTRAQSDCLTPRVLSFCESLRHSRTPSRIPRPIVRTYRDKVSSAGCQKTLHEESTPLGELTDCLGVVLVPLIGDGLVPRRNGSAISGNSR